MSTARYVVSDVYVNGLREAIPPAYTSFIGEQLLAHIGIAA